jgi:photosystem II stability/assembly factor-like uncharacterized protein
MRPFFTNHGLIVLMIAIAIIAIDRFQWEKKVYPGSGEDNCAQEWLMKKKKRQHGYAKMNAPDEFMKMHRLMRTGEGMTGPGYRMNYRFEEMVKAGMLPKDGGLIRSGAAKAGASVLPWIERGPANVAGRTRGLIVDPDDATHLTWFAGSVGGGVWKTTNGGDTWTHLTPSLSNLATTVLAMAPSNHDVIYLGTGEGFFNLDAVDGDGIWKSTDRGLTWFQLASTVAINGSNQNFRSVNRIIIDPSNANVLVAATNTGIYRSTDGGTSWNTAFSGGGRIQHVVANPSNFNTQYAGTDGGNVLKSTDRGVSWFLRSTGVSGDRVELAVSPVDTNRIFASVEGSFLFTSNDGGASWAKVIVTQPGTTAEFDFLGGQGWYDNTIAAHPYDDSTVFVGGVDVFRVDLGPAGASSRGITSVDYENTSSFLSFVGFSGGYTTGIGYGANYFGGGSYGLTVGDCTTVEIRFGSGETQKAHRMNRAFLTDNSYTYIDYSDVPFEVWDITNNRQLMVSYLDSSNNGFFNLSEWSGNFTENIPREAIFVHAIPYNASTPFDSIVNGHGGKEGHKFKNSYVITPALASGANWDPTTLPTSTLRINFGFSQTFTSTTTAITDGYNQYQGGVGNVHVDHHNLVMIPVSAPNNFKILNANDGGLSFSTDGGTNFYKDQNTVNGYNTTQFYGLDKKPGSSQYIAGAQDNGTWISPVNASAISGWTSEFGGDGFDGAWKYNDPNQIIGGSQYNGFQKTTNGGTTWFLATSGLATGSGNAPFTSPIGKSNLEPDVIYAVGLSGVYQSTNFGTNWQLKSISTNWNMWSLTTVEVSEADPTIVWAGGGMSSTRRLHVSTDGGQSFMQTTNYSDGLGTIGLTSGIATHPTDRNTAYALFSVSDRPKILRTTDLGQNWEDISGFGTNSNSSNGFPDVAVYSLLVIPHNTNELWAGTEIGLFISTDNGASWSYSNNGLPPVSIWQMRAVDQQVIVSTHGRGVWTCDIAQLPETVVAPKIQNLTAGNNEVTFTVTIRQVSDSVVVYVDNVPLQTLTNTTPRDVAISYPTTETALKRFQAVSFKNGYAYRSVEKSINVAFDPDIDAPSVTLGALASPIVNVVRFGVGANEPIISVNILVNGSPLTISKKGSLFFGNYILTGSGNLTVEAIAEDTSDNTGSSNKTYQVGQLGKVNSYANYSIQGNGEGYLLVGPADEIETPEGWTRLGQQVDVVATGLDREVDVQMDYRNLIDRLRTEKEYDEGKVGVYSLQNGQWVYVGGEGTKGMVKTRTAAGTFAVFYNPDHQVTPKAYALERNYPNPFNPTTTIRYSVPVDSRVVIRVYNVLGQEVRTLVNEVRSAGRHEVVWDARDDAGKSVATGLYLYRLEAKGFSQVRKMMLIK